MQREHDATECWDKWYDIWVSSKLLLCNNFWCNLSAHWRLSLNNHWDVKWFQFLHFSMQQPSSLLRWLLNYGCIAAESTGFQYLCDIISCITLEYTKYTRQGPLAPSYFVFVDISMNFWNSRQNAQMIFKFCLKLVFHLEINRLNENIFNLLFLNDTIDDSFSGSITQQMRAK